MSRLIPGEFVGLPQTADADVPALFADHSADHSASPPPIASAGAPLFHAPAWAPLGRRLGPSVTASWVLGPTFRSLRACCLSLFEKKQSCGSSTPTAHGLGKKFVRLTLTDPASAPSLSHIRPLLTALLRLKRSPLSLEQERA